MTTLLVKCPSVQWEPDGLTIQRRKWFLGAGFLGAPPISLINAPWPCGKDCCQNPPQEWVLRGSDYIVSAQELVDSDHISVSPTYEMILLVIMSTSYNHNTISNTCDNNINSTNEYTYQCVSLASPPYLPARADRGPPSIGRLAEYCWNTTVQTINKNIQ